MLWARIHIRTSDQVDGRCAQKTGYKCIDRLLVKRHGFANLCNAPLVHDGNSVPHGHGLDLIVRDIDHGAAQLFVKARQLNAHAHAQRRIQVRQRFVKQKDFGFSHDGSANGDSLAFTARQCLGQAGQQVRDFQNVGGSCHCLFSLHFGYAVHAQGKTHVLSHRHVGVQCVVLKHHGRAAIRWVHFIGAHTVHQKIALCDAFKSSDHAQQSGFSATRWPY